MLKNINTDTLKTWNELDGQRVQFLSNHRPRARYLYFHYCVSILRRSWNQTKQWELLKKELGKKIWATSGRYLSKTQLLAFAGELGHEVGDSLMQGCKDPDSDAGEVDETALAAANDQIRITAGTEPSSSTTLLESDDEESDDEDEEDYE
jgi:hypothetical protein